MTDRSTRALADAAARLVEPHDVSGTLAALMTGIGSALDVGACGIVVANRDNRFEVLSASSHSPSDLALFESVAIIGPAVHAWAQNDSFAASGLDAVRAQWPGLAGAMSFSGYQSLLACPLRWNLEPMGAALVFGRDDKEFSDADRRTLQAFADLSMVVVMHSDGASVRTAAGRIDEALASRVLVEQAKGVIAQQRGVAMADAYGMLQTIAVDDGVSLSDAAARIVRQAGWQ